MPSLNSRVKLALLTNLSGCSPVSHGILCCRKLSLYVEKLHSTPTKIE